jgi:pilus assembly protein CpaD
MEKRVMADTKLRAAANHRFAFVAIRAVAAAVVATALSGCYSPRYEGEPIAANDFKQRHPITVAEGERTFTVFVGTQRGGLLPQQRADVLAFTQAWRREATGAVILDVPVTSPNPRSTNDAVKEIQSLLRASDIPSAAVRIRQYQPVDATKVAVVKINYSRLVAETHKCGLWPKDLGPDTDAAWQENRPYWNFGCASQQNLAAMLDNPADIVQPRGEASAYAPRRSQAMEKYRKGESPATTYPNPNQGKISDVGQ